MSAQLKLSGRQHGTSGTHPAPRPPPAANVRSEPAGVGIKARAAKPDGPDDDAVPRSAAQRSRREPFARCREELDVMRGRRHCRLAKGRIRMGCGGSQVHACAPCLRHGRRQHRRHRDAPRRASCAIFALGASGHTVTSTHISCCVFVRAAFVCGSGQRFLFSFSCLLRCRQAAAPSCG